MKLDRNLGIGRGKYLLVKLRINGPVALVDHAGFSCAVIPEQALDWGNTPDSEFFVIRLKDKYAAPALMAYADAAASDDPEWAKEVMALAKTAEVHPNKTCPT